MRQNQRHDRNRRGERVPKGRRLRAFIALASLAASSAQAEDLRCKDIDPPQAWRDEHTTAYISGVRDAYWRGFLSAWGALDGNAEFATDMMFWLATQHGETLTLMIRDRCNRDSKKEPSMTILDALESLIIENYKPHRSEPESNDGEEEKPASNPEVDA